MRPLRPRTWSRSCRASSRTPIFVGYPKAHLWVEADGADDMDLFVLIQKLDAWARRCSSLPFPTRAP